MFGMHNCVVTDGSVAMLMALVHLITTRVDGPAEVQEMHLPFVRYKSRSLRRGNTLRHVSLSEIKKLEVSADDVPQLRKFFEFVHRMSQRRRCADASSAP